MKAGDKILCIKDYKRKYDDGIVFAAGKRYEIIKVDKSGMWVDGDMLNQVDGEWFDYDYDLDNEWAYLNYFEDIKKTKRNDKLKELGITL